MVIGKSSTGYHIASDLAAIDSSCKDYHDLAQKTVYIVHQSQGIEAIGKSISWKVIPTQSNLTLDSYHNYAHKTLEEIHSQPEIINHILTQPDRDEPIFKQLQILVQHAEHILLLGCGSSRYCGQSAKYWLEAIAQKPTQVELASEFSHRNPCLAPNTLVISISQSGETQDTIQALRHIQQHLRDKITLNVPSKDGKKSQNIVATVCLGNQPLSTLAKESTLFIPSHANKEIGVATTKVFTCQLLRFAQMTYLAKPSHPIAFNLKQALPSLPSAIKQTLGIAKNIEKMTAAIQHKSQLLFLGKGILYPIAEETSLKVQELAYIHAQAYATGELKHGPLALVDTQQICIVLVSHDTTLPLVISSIHEIAARDGQVIAVGPASALTQIDAGLLQASLELPEAPIEIAPFVSIVAMQLFAYYLALHRGCEIDQPRNLAKSVTVQ